MPSNSWPLTSPLARSACLVDDRAGLEPGVEVVEVDDRVELLERAVDEAALGDAAGQRHLAALEDRAELEPLARGVALVPLGRGLAVTRADPAADPLPLLAAVDALMDVVQLH